MSDQTGPTSIGRLIGEVLSRMQTVDNQRAVNRPPERVLPTIKRDRESVHQAFWLAVNEAARNQRYPVYFSGPPGIGKTCAALCWIDSAQDRLRHKGLSSSARYWKVNDLVVEYQQCVAGRLIGSDDLPIRPQRFWEQFERLQIVVIDEIGTENGVPGIYEWLPAEQAVVFETVDRRVRSKMPLMLLSNWTVSELIEYGRYDEPTIDRIRGGQILHLADVPSRRHDQ